MAGGNLVRAVLEVVVSFVKEGFESLTADSDKYQVFCDLNELYECCVLLSAIKNRLSKIDNRKSAI